ncbi:MAG: hypothetical protein GEU92_15675 [Alphaproteobacteria bacterium]|nr:hypothetical protein [Alphaproteobacteria bacterium]
MRKAAIISALLHVSVFVFAWFGLPSLFRDDPLHDQMVQVEMVVLDEPPKPEPKPAPPKPKPAPKPVAAPPPPPPEPPPVPEPPKLAEVAPEPPPPEPEPVPAPKEKPKPKPEPKPKAEPKPAPKPVAKAPPKPAPKPKPKPKAKPKPPPDQFQNILKDLAREKAALEKSESKDRKKDQVAAVPPEPKADRPASRATDIDSARASAQLASLVKQQVTPCWNIPGGAKDAQKMQIAVRIQLNPDGTLRGPPRIEDAARMSSDPFYRAMAESAARALRLPSCTPLRLPYAQYDLWKDITLIFDPSEALGP